MITKQGQGMWQTAVSAVMSIFLRAPPPDADGCITVTTDNFETVVLKNNIDVLIVLYTTTVMHMMIGD